MAGKTGGIDRAAEAHEVCITEEGRVVERFSAGHDEQGIAGLAAGIEVLAIHPNQVKAARPRFAVAHGKSDRFDAYVLAEPARTDAHRFRALVPDTDATKARRAPTRAREDLVATRVEMANQLRAHLEAFWPGALIFSDVDSSVSLAFLQRCPSPQDAKGLGERRMEAFLRRNAYSGRAAAAELLARTKAAPKGTAGSGESEARRAVVLGLVAALGPIVAQIAELTS